MATILVVDDNAINRKLLVALLSGDGYLTVEASDGVDGLTMAHAHRPQLIISDILMPSMDGYGFVRALRDDADLRGTPVIFYTAHYHEREAHKLARDCGVTRVLVKPCPNAEILRAVEQAMAGLSESGPATVPSDFDREHLRLLTNKLSQRAEELAVSNSRFLAMADLNLEIASERDRHALLERACSGARSLLGARFAVLAVAEESADSGVHFVTSGIDSGRVPPGAPDLHAGALGRVLTQRLPWRSGDSTGEAQDPGFPLGYPKARAYLGVPIMTPTRIYGWLCLAGKIGADSFDADDEKLLLTLGALAGRNYENVRLQSELQRQSAKLQRALTLLGGVNALVAQARERDEVCQEACRLAVERAHYRLAYVEIAESGVDTGFVAAVGEHSDIEKVAWRRGAARAERDDLVEIAVSTDSPAICNDLRSTQLRVRQREELLSRGFRAMAVLPLQGSPGARLILLGSDAGIFDDPELRLLNEFAGGVSLALLQAAELAPVGP